MINPKLIDQLTAGIARALPPGMDEIKSDLARSIRAAASAALAQMDLVTREEFEIQSELLSRTRALLDELENRIKELEEQQDS